MAVVLAIRCVIYKHSSYASFIFTGIYIKSEKYGRKTANVDVWSRRMVVYIIYIYINHSRYKLL